MSGKCVFSETKVHDVDVEENVRDCVVGHGGDDVTWM